jgi:hypothetical protein
MCVFFLGCQGNIIQIIKEENVPHVRAVLPIVGTMLMIRLKYSLFAQMQRKSVKIVTPGVFLLFLQLINCFHKE